jgi:predicted Zn finger-like uncharacterized protein
MLIVCPNCATSYQVAPSALGATGRSVRCVRCRKVWYAANTAAMAEIALSHHQDMAALAGAAGAPSGALASADEPPEPPGELDRDDRGPAPLREPRDPVPVAEPAGVNDSATLAPAHPDNDRQAAVEALRGDIESVAARRTRRPPTRRGAPVSGWAAAILLLVAVNVGLVGWRADVVRLVPQAAAIYAAIGLDVNLRGLVFTEVVTRRETQDGTPMLLVEGVIKSTSKRDADVPRLRFAVRNAQGHEIYSWTALPEQNVLGPGTSMPFRSRLASPPAEAHAVLVRFFHRRDLVAGLQ